MDENGWLILKKIGLDYERECVMWVIIKFFFVGVISLLGY